MTIWTPERTQAFLTAQHEQFLADVKAGTYDAKGYRPEERAAKIARSQMSLFDHP